MKSDWEMIVEFIEENHELFADFLSENYDIDPTDWEYVLNQARSEVEL